MRWWNVNGRWRIADKEFLNSTDIIFISESHCSCLSMPEIDGFKIVGDNNFPLISKHGGNVAYIKNEIYEHIISLRYSKVSLAFNFSFAPNVVFMGNYIYPINSYNYVEGDFAILSNDIHYWLEKGAIPYIGGDFNSRIGDINAFSQDHLKWRYSNNVDSISNQHGKSLLEVCDVHHIQPINHCNYYNTQFDGCFTYWKGEKKSQIDFLITNSEGRRLITEFNIIQTGWHTSDHLPLELKVEIPLHMNAAMVF